MYYSAKVYNECRTNIPKLSVCLDGCGWQWQEMVVAFKKEDSKILHSSTAENGRDKRKPGFMCQGGGSWSLWHCHGNSERQEREWQHSPQLNCGEQTRLEEAKDTKYTRGDGGI
jgi:hypothetical protein